MVKALGLMAWLAFVAAPVRAEVQDTFAAKPLQLRDPAKDLRDAEHAVSRGGGADAYLARADAKRSLGRPFKDYIVDYAEAAKLDPKRYAGKFRGILAQQESETKRDAAKPRHAVAAGDKDANILTKVMFVCALALIIVIAGLVLVRGRARAD